MMNKHAAWSWLLAISLCASGSALAYPKFAPANSSQAAYLNALKQTHQQSDARSALLAEVNMLLKHYALKDGQQNGALRATNQLYQVRVEAPGELIVRLDQGAPQAFKVSSTRYNVFGVDPYVQYDCQTQPLACEIKLPSAPSPWLMIVRDRQGAAELAKALSYLLRDLQKG